MTELVRITPEQAAWLLDVLNHPNMAVPTSDTKKLRLASDTKEALEALAQPAKLSAVK